MDKIKQKLSHKGKRTVVLIIENDTIDDTMRGKSMVHEVEQTLEKYLELLKRDDAACLPHEVYEGPTNRRTSAGDNP